MRFNYVLFAVAATLVATFTTTAAHAPTTPSFPGVADQTNGRGNENRMLRAHKDPRTNGAEERGGFSFFDVVDEVLSKMRGEKPYKCLMKSNSMKEVNTLKYPRVKEHLADIGVFKA
ncbi:unnamed protein product [Phytophthora lilii]|uniref:RxLR effector protein n=1 Tax=Phytophthora lilii TaxID=2077276 RepID=A0A9W6TXF6_9STRA|nr:unnamed protein product [Phytophthora lilii]